MNMRTPLVTVLIARGISVIAIDARAATADISNAWAISTASKITAVMSVAPTIRVNRIQIQEPIDQEIGSGSEINYANITGRGIAITAGTIEIIDNSIRAI